MRLILTVIAMAAASPALASDQATNISDTIKRCWVAPAAVEGKSLSATFEIDISADGAIKDITAKSFPSGDEGKLFAKSASRAIERCAPYADLPKGKVLVTFKTPDRKEPIDPFK